MGLYADIQNDVGEALLGDLNDAYKTISVTSFGVATYDPDTGTSTSVDDTQDCLCVVGKTKRTDVLDNSDTIADMKFLVLDKDKPFDFELGQKIDYNNLSYKIATKSTDPVGATWTLLCIYWK